ncbi:MAG: hypothetical protein MUC96_12910 [Myxococcaceae bacterium]|jgi:hypothetical protein|nr:hypothetical protein [Myxococcaceae bacterium]
MGGVVKVSVWAGHVESAERLEAALTPDASCHGDSLGSDVSRAMGDDTVADAVREWRVLDRPTTSMRALLDGLSFAGPLGSALTHDLPRAANAVVLFFAVETVGSRVELPGVWLERLGVVPVVRVQRVTGDQ